MRHGLLLIGLLCFALSLAPAQTGQIHGRVTDAATGGPLPGATIAERSYEYNFECGISTTPDCPYRRDPEFWFKLLLSIGLNWNWDL